MIAAKIAWRNVWRNTRRSLLTLLALAFSTAMLLFMFAWQTGSYDSMIHAAVSSTTGELQILSPEYHDKRDIRKTIDRPGDILGKLEGMEDVSAFTMRGEAFALADSGERSYGVLVLGVDPEREPTVSNIRTIIREGAFFSGEGNEIILGRKLADNLKAGIGDEIVLLGQGYDGSVAANAFVLQGIAESGQPDLDRTLAQIPLATFQETFFMGDRVHRIVVNGSSLEVLDQVAGELEAWLSQAHPDLDVFTWDELVPGLKQSIELDMISGYIFYFLLLVVVAFSIMNTFIMAVMERSREFGILNAIGTNRHQLVRILLMETCFLGLCGILLGLVGGLAFTLYMQANGIVIPDSQSLMAKFGLPERIYPQLTWFVTWLAPLLVLGVTLLSTLYPVIRLLRLNPVKAMHDQ
jgi:ABC-type lipoprotein release transport system permease subunit